MSRRAESGEPRRRRKSSKSDRRERPAGASSSRNRATASLPAEPPSDAKPSSPATRSWPLVVGGVAVVLVVGAVAWSFRGGEVDALEDVEPVPEVASVPPAAPAAPAVDPPQSTNSSEPTTKPVDPSAKNTESVAKTAGPDPADEEAELIAAAKRRQAEFEKAATGESSAGDSNGGSSIDDLDFGGLGEELFEALEPKEVTAFARLPGDWSGLRAIRLAPDGGRLYLGLADGRVACVDVETRREVWRSDADAETDAEGGRLQALVVSSDGATVVSAGSEAIVLFDVVDGERRRTVPVASPVTTLVDQGTTFVAGHVDGTLVRYSLESIEPTATVDFGAYVTAAAMCGERLVVGDWSGRVHVLDAESLESVAEPVELHDAAVHSVVGDERAATVAANDGRIASVWLTEVGVGRRYELQSPRPLVRVGTLSFLSGRDDGVLELWGDRDELVTHRLVGHESPVHSVVFDDEKRLVVSASWDGSVRLWKLPR